MKTLIYALLALASLVAIADPHDPVKTDHDKISPQEEKLVAMEKWLYHDIKVSVCERKYSDGLIPNIEALAKDPAFSGHEIQPTPIRVAMESMEKILGMKVDPHAGFLERIQNICLALPQPDADTWFRQLYGDIPKMKLLERLVAAERVFDPYEKGGRDRYRAGQKLPDRMRYLREFISDAYGVPLAEDATFAAKFKEITGKDLPKADLTKPLSPELATVVREALHQGEEAAEKQFRKRIHTIRNPETGVLPNDIIRRADRLYRIFQEYVPK